MSAEMQLPSIVTETNVVVKISTAYENMAEFETAHGEVESDSITNFTDTYGTSSPEPSAYENGEVGPVSLGIAIQDPTPVPSSSTGSASSALDSFYEGGGEHSSAGGATIKPKEIFAALSPLVATYRAGRLAYRGAQLWNIAPEIALPCIAALCGYELGENLVEQNPDLWIDALSETYPWAFHHIDKKLALLNYGDKTYMDGRLMEAMYDWFLDHIGYPYFNKKVNVGSSSYKYMETDSETSVELACYYRTGTQSAVHTCVLTIPANSFCFFYLFAPSNYGSVALHFVYSSGTTASISNDFYNGPDNWYHRTTSGLDSTTQQGNSYKMGFIEIGTRPTSSGYYSASPISYKIETSYADALATEESVVDAIMNGDSSDVEFPTGVSTWPGQKVTSISSGAIDVAVNVSTGTTVPFYPVAMPVYGTPRLDPVTNPDPTTPTSGDQISNYFDYSTNITNNYNTPSDPAVDPTDDTPDYPEPSNQLTPIPDEGTTPTNNTPTSDDPFDPNTGGVFNVYNPTSSQLNSFNDWLWVTYRDTTIPKILNNPFDGVISLHEVYAPVPISGSSPIRSGFLVSNVTANMASRFSELNCGTVIVPERYGNYLDYSPYTKVTVYLPFIGMVDLNADDIIGNAVNIKYRFDIYTGACVAIITVARVAQSGEEYEAEMYHFPGNCAVQFPISGGSQATVMAGLVLSGVQAIGSVAENVISGIFTGARAGVGAGIASGVAGGLSDIASLANSASKMKSDVRHSGSMQGNFGAMDNKTPYLVVRRPKQVRVEGYNQEYGYPAHAFVTIGGVTGYLRVREVNVISSTATDAEKEKIEALLKEGVFVT